jgi:hypothetical protein
MAQLDLFFAEGSVWLQGAPATDSLQGARGREQGRRQSAQRERRRRVEYTRDITGLLDDRAHRCQPLRSLFR